MTPLYAYAFIAICIIIIIPTVLTSLLTLTSLSPGIFAVNLSIGFPEHNFLLLIATCSEYTWIRGVNCTFCSTFENIYNEKESITVIYPDDPEGAFTTMIDIRGAVSGVLAFDDMNIGNLLVNKLEFLIASEDQFIEMADGVLSLAPSNPKDKNANLLTQLYDNSKIREKVFSLNLKDEMSAQLNIGEIPEYMLADKSKLSYCRVHKEYNNNWNCLISHIFFNNDYNFYNAIPLKETIVNFSTGISNIFIPIDYIDLFINHYFKSFPEYSNKKCIINKASKTKNILCLKSFLNVKERPNIHFIINGYAYSIPFEDLFEDVLSESYNQYRVFKIVFIETAKNEWFFGTVFIKQHEMVFNDEKGEVGFYSGIKHDFTKLTNENVEEYCLYNSMTIIVLALIIILPMIYTIWMKKITDDRLNILALTNLKKA